MKNLRHPKTCTVSNAWGFQEAGDDRIGDDFGALRCTQASFNDERWEEGMEAGWLSFSFSALASSC